ncbi:NADPH-dependent F420 reductase [Virgisporangium ochraceum]|jgi:NADPH-dependent F420 reductase|uniref:NADPH-dependent F420 reductase n=1 Tax=Virgisporangium ochraceum TaxID=65505 RepID=A0A8J4EE86_9ACTN|nr:NADPH-dependent F420 reductase [Virgisporangium ochraceum]GIJ68772.1 NADPH-dependent F420 reductase [Virgisporangium ochraceum]
MTFDESALPDVSDLTIGILGGTGPQGRGLAYRFARGGLTVRIGSRDAARGEQSAAELPGVDNVTGGGNEYAADADVVVVAVPWEAHEPTLLSLKDRLAGKIVVDCVNPLGFDGRGPFALPVAEGSAAQQAEALLPESRVCAAFHHVSAVLLVDPEVARIDLDVLVLGDDREAAAVVQAIAGRVDGMRGIWAGRLRNAAQVEALTANLIAINKRYKVHAGVRVTDV